MDYKIGRIEGKEDQITSNIHLKIIQMLMNYYTNTMEIYVIRILTMDI